MHPAVATAAGFVAGAVTTWMVDKALDKTAHAIHEHVRNVERNQQQARQRQAAQQHGQMRAYPGYGLLPDGGEIADRELASIGGLDPADSVAELLEKRKQLLAGG